MKPNFALSLSVDGIRLLHRVGAGWSLVGEVGLDAPDLASQLSVLRKTGLALDPQGLRTKLLIPNDQIKYLSLDTTRAAEDDILRALDGATPYAVTDLVYDYVRGGGRTYVAAVARETLAEAEGFAAEHRFNPVCFAAVPNPFTYMGEAFFGPTQVAPSLIGPGQSVERDDTAVIMPAKPRKAGFMAPAAEPVTEPLVLAGQDAPPPEPTWLPDALPDPVAVIASEPALTPDMSALTAALQMAKIAEKPSGPAVETVEINVDPALFQPTETGHDTAPVDIQTLPDTPAVNSIAADGVIDVVPDADRADPVFPEPIVETATEPMPPLVPEAVFSSRSRPLRADPSDVPAATRPLPPPPGSRTPRSDDDKAEPVFSRRAEPPLSKPFSPMVAVPEPAILPDQTTVSAVADLTKAIESLPKPPPPLAASLAKQQISGEPLTGPRLTGPRLTGPRLTGAARQSSDPVFARPVSTSIPSAAAAPTITGRSGGALPATAVVASVVPLRSNPDTGTALAAMPVPIETVTLAPAKSPLAAAALQSARLIEPAANGAFVSKASAGDTPSVAEQPLIRGRAGVGGKPRYLGLLLTLILLACLAAVAAWATYTTDNVVARWFGWTDQTAIADLVPEVAAPAQTQQVPPEIAETVLLAPDMTNLDPLPDLLPAPPPEIQPEIIAAPAPDAAAAPAPQTAPVVAADQIAVPGAIISPAEADRIYAATGVWLRAPRLPLIPTTESIGTISRAALDRGADKLALPVLPLLANVVPDQSILPQLDPPAPGTVFARDARGFVLATPEGTLTPDGILIFAGSPAIIPPTRPGTPLPTPAAAPQLLAVSAPPLAPRPVDPGPTVDPATTGGVGLASLDPSLGVAPDPLPTPGVRPAIRPVIRPEGSAPAQVITPQTVAFGGTRPPLRPAGLTPETPNPALLPDPALTSSLVPTDTDGAVADTVAAILAAAPPDATATATTLAVASARIPVARPQNFADVVASAQQRDAPAPESQAQDASLAVIEPQAPVAPATIEPSGPVSGDVATAATLEQAIDLREINLLGVFGQPNDRRALVRLANGRTVQVEVGDSLDGGEVAAIGDNALNYVKRGRTITLAIPNG